MTQVITPTPGRIVHFFPGVADGMAQPGRGTSEAQPLAATIAMVHNERMVNLSALDAYGNPHARPNVRLVQPDTEVPTDGTSYATWMPYQVGQAVSNGQIEAPSAPAVEKTEAESEAIGSTVETETADTTGAEGSSEAAEGQQAEGAQAEGQQAQ